MRNWLTFFVVLLLVLLVSACGRSDYNPLPADATILAFGDSLTAGVGTAVEQSYPSVLAQLSGRNVINAGVSGETTSQGLQRFSKLLDQHSPHLIILLEGGNDILRNQTFASTKSNLATMISEARTRQIPVLLLGVPEKNLFSSSAAVYSELAEEHDVMFIKSLVSDLLRTSRYKSDPVHLNAEGYRAMAEDIFDFLNEKGLL